MKASIFSILLCISISPFSTLFAQVLYQENFETNTNGTNYTTSVPEFTDFISGNSTSGKDFFTRTNGSNINANYQISGKQGNFFFTAQDINGDGADEVQSITTTSIAISGETEVTFSVLMAEDDDGTNQDWDTTDYFHITYSLDGGAAQNLLWIESEGTTINTTPRIDTDFDGIGDGEEITNTFVNFTRAINVSGSSNIIIKLEFSLNSGDEDLAIDTITLESGTVLNLHSLTLDKPTFSIAPNPCNQETVQILTNINGSQKVNIYSSSGVLLESQFIKKEEFLNVSRLVSGIYFLELTSELGSMIKKLLIL